MKKLTYHQDHHQDLWDKFFGLFSTHCFTISRSDDWRRHMLRCWIQWSRLQSWCGNRYRDRRCLAVWQCQLFFLFFFASFHKGAFLTRSFPDLKHQIPTQSFKCKSTNRMLFYKSWMQCSKFLSAQILF